MVCTVLSTTVSMPKDGVGNVRINSSNIIRANRYFGILVITGSFFDDDLFLMEQT